MAKSLCDWNKKKLTDQPELLRKIVAQPTYYCRKCARVAGDKRYLCKAAKFPTKVVDLPMAG